LQFRRFEPETTRPIYKIKSFATLVPSFLGTRVIYWVAKAAKKRDNTELRFPEFEVGQISDLSFDARSYPFFIK
jgi:hypothetical protein